MDKISFLNKQLKHDKSAIKEIPCKLYKYRQFDEYTIDMLENNYLYLCPANKLDDETECNTICNLNELIDYDTGKIANKLIDLTIDILRPYTSYDNIEIFTSYLKRNIVKSGNINGPYLLEFDLMLQELAPNYKDHALMINWLRMIPDYLNDNKTFFDIIISTNMKLNEQMGICSLAIEFNNLEMWEKYTNNIGYCIEYDINNYKNTNKIYPVIYDDHRNTNIFDALISDTINKFISVLKNDETLDMTHLLRLFLTKNTKWSYQNEWRIVGDPSQKLAAPKISKIYISNLMDEYQKNQIICFCDKNKIDYKIFNI